jgi:hypothetical protein
MEHLKLIKQRQKRWKIKLTTCMVKNIFLKKYDTDGKPPNPRDEGVDAACTII